MKPVAINLVLKRNIQGKFFLGLLLIIVFTTIGITIVSMVDYTANIKVIKTYELRVKEINQRAERKRAVGQKKVTNQKEYQKIKQDLNYLSGILKKNMFSLPKVLTEIERIKPDKIDINELIFSDNLTVVMIRGESNHAGSVSKFIIGMDRSKQFNIELSREEIDENKRIIFELTARWISVENDQKI